MDTDYSTPARMGQANSKNPGNHSREKDWKNSMEHFQLPKNSSELALVVETVKYYPFPCLSTAVIPVLCLLQVYCSTMKVMGYSPGYRRMWGVIS